MEKEGGKKVSRLDERSIEVSDLMISVSNSSPFLPSFLPSSLPFTPTHLPPFSLPSLLPPSSLPAPQHAVSYGPVAEEPI